MIQFPCPGCGKRLRAKPENAGQNCRCPSCNLSVPVPLQSAMAEPLLELDDDPAPLPAPPPPMPLRSQPQASPPGESAFSKAKKWVATIGGILFMVVCVGVVKQMTKAAVREEVLPNPYADKKKELFGNREPILRDREERKPEERKPDEPKREVPPPPRDERPAQPSRDEQMSRLLVGTWRLDLMRDGIQAVTMIDYRADGTYNLAMTATRNGLKVASTKASGTWRISGGKLQLHIQETDMASMRGKSYADEILELTSEKYVIRDGDGKVETGYRVRG